MRTADLVIEIRLGLHARPASDFVACARRFTSDVYVRNATKSDRLFDAKSPMHLLAANLAYGDVLHIETEGPDEREAIEALVEVVRSAS